MPTSPYPADDPAADCPMCGDGFETMQTISEAPLATCPSCAQAVHRIVRHMPQCVTNHRWNTKKILSDGNLKAKGFKKLVKDSSGKYVDVLQD
ncbi:MAG: zinc ribbon domain-containing protein [Planctomycetota bacterium]|nr:zinc ribbon domain-containing protein [Planctomycetota bacterium]